MGDKAKGSVRRGGRCRHQGFSEQPIDVERRITAYLRDKFKGRPVGFIDNIGAPMSHSIFWCHYSDFFVTFYGTGLAKYRWAATKPV
jgi:hypothetical protein